MALRRRTILMSRTARTPIARRAEHRRARRRSIDPAEASRLIWVIADALAHVAGGPDTSPWSQAMGHRIYRPEVGDLVVEVSSFRRGAAFDPDRVGWLRDIGYMPDSVSDLHPDGFPVWYLVEPLAQPSRGPLRTVRWANARFYAVPVDTGYRWPYTGGTISDRAGAIVRRQGNIRADVEYSGMILKPESLLRIANTS
jgi:hypothetical protein